MGLFSYRVIGNGELIITYYGNIGYEDTSKNRRGKKYGESAFGYDAECFMKKGIELKAKDKDANGKRHPIIIVPWFEMVPGFNNK